LSAASRGGGAPPGSPLDGRRDVGGTDGYRAGQEAARAALTGEVPRRADGLQNGNPAGSPGRRPAVPSAINPAALEELRHNLRPAGEEVLGQMIDLFLDDIPSALAGMESAAAHQDADALARAAHRLRGGAATLGADGLETLCAQAELLGWAGDMTGAGPLAGHIAAEIDRVQVDLGARIRPRV
jgi:hypothetical protein